MRLPGESVSEEIERVREAAFGDNLALLAITAAMTMTAGLQWWFGTPPRTLFVVTSGFFIVSVAYVIPRLRVARKRLRALRQAKDGERSVAEYLDILREQDGMRVLHDIEGEAFNLDHVVIANQGIYVIETKTISKPLEGYSKISYDGERVRIAGYEPSKNPVEQAQAEVSWLRRLLRDSLRRDYPIRPVVVFPGWFVEATPRARGAKVWVLNPKALQSFIRREPVSLSAKDVAEVTTFLKRYIRSTPRR